jgi:hypothetical protein
MLPSGGASAGSVLGHCLAQAKTHLQADLNGDTANDAWSGFAPTAALGSRAASRRRDSSAAICHLV